MRKLSVDKIICGLRAISEDEFCPENVYQFLTDNAICCDSLQPYVYFSRRNYTRNLIYKNELFEMLAVCWDSGQVSRIHDHDNQECWMSAHFGKLRIQNYKLLEVDHAGKRCRLGATDVFDIGDGEAARVEHETPIHQVLNSKEFNARAVSLHVYSRPITRCNVYSIPRGEFVPVELCYTSMYGKLCAAAKL